MIGVILGFYRVSIRVGDIRVILGLYRVSIRLLLG